MSWSIACGAAVAGELGRCGMSPRTCERATPGEHRSMVGAAPRSTRPCRRCPRFRRAFGCAPKPGKAGRRGGNRDVQLLPTAGVAAVMPWWGILQASVVQIRHRAEMGAVWHQPSSSLRQRPPAATLMGSSFSGRPALHRPLGVPQPVQLRRQRPGAVLQILQVAEAVERPPIGTARPAAPIAGLRGARTGVVGLGPARAAAGLVDPRAGCDGDLPGPARLPAPHKASPPLARLPGSNQPTEPAGTAQPEPHRSSTVLPGGRACRARPGRLTRRRNGRRVLRRGGLDRPVVSGAARVGLVRPTHQVVDGPLGPFSRRCCSCCAGSDSHHENPVGCRNSDLGGCLPIRLRRGSVP
jgi:hypothetical protein